MVLHGPLLHYWILLLEGQLPCVSVFTAVCMCACIASRALLWLLLESRGLAVHCCEGGIGSDRILRLSECCCLAEHLQCVISFGFRPLAAKAYAIVLGLLARRKLKETFHDLRRTLPAAMWSSWRFWPFVHLASCSGMNRE